MLLNDICLEPGFVAHIFGDLANIFTRRQHFYEVAYETQAQVGILVRWLFEVEGNNCPWRDQAGQCISEKGLRIDVLAV